jgi:hypothetical protein
MRPTALALLLRWSATTMAATEVLIASIGLSLRAL